MKTIRAIVDSGTCFLPYGKWRASIKNHIAKIY